MAAEYGAGLGHTASVALRKFRYAAKAMNVTPQQVAKMSPKEATYFLIEMVSKFDREGKRGSTIESYYKAVKNWMAWNDITITKKIKINQSEQGLYETEVVPAAKELKRILDVSNLRTKVVVNLMAFCGVRPEVVGNLVTDDSLRVGDFPEMMTGSISGHVTITATYMGDPNNQVSSRTAKLTIKNAT